MRKFVGESRSSAFITATGKLVMGTAAGHAITLAVLPVLTRLYTPADFGALAVLSGAIGIFSAAACARFDVAIPLPEEDREASSLLVLSLACVSGLSLVIGLVVGSRADALANLIGQPGLAHLWILFPLGLFCTGAMLALQNWFVRRKQFGVLARNRIYQSGVAAGGQLTLGLAGVTPLGLLVGPIVNAAIACVGLGTHLWRRERQFLAGVGLTSVFIAARRYQRFPRFSAAEALLNSAAIQLPILFISGHATAAEVGSVALAMSILQVPMALMGTAVGQVFLSQASTEFRAGSLRAFTVRVLYLLLKSGGPVILTAGLVAPIAVSFAFGRDWARAGHLVTWMTPWFLLQFLASPISFALHVTGRLGTATALQLACLIVRLGAVYAAATLLPQRLAEVYALSGAIAYGLYLLVVLQVVKQSDSAESAGTASRAPMSGEQE